MKRLVPSFRPEHLVDAGRSFEVETSAGRGGPRPTKPVADIPGKEVETVFAAYVKRKEEIVRKQLKGKGVDFDALPVERGFSSGD
jgi:hypothetical protein